MKYLILLVVAVTFSCDNHKTVSHADLPEGVVLKKEMYNVQKYELLIETAQGLERVEVDSDFYIYIEPYDTIVQPY